MKTISYRKGFSIIEAIVFVVVISGLVFLGVKAYESWQTMNLANEAAKSQSKTASDIPAASSVKDITSASDIDATFDTLNSVNTDDDSDLTLLTNEAASF